MVDRTRQTRTVQLSNLSYDLEGSVDDAIQTLIKLKCEHPSARLAYEDISVRYEDSRYGIAVYETRPETDEEMNKRIAQEETREQQIEASDRAKLIELMSKYGNPNEA